MMKKFIEMNTFVKGERGAIDQNMDGMDTFKFMFCFLCTHVLQYQMFFLLLFITHVCLFFQRIGAWTDDIFTVRKNSVVFHHSVVDF